MGEGVGRNVGMPLDAFIEEAYNGLAAGNDTTFVGSPGPAEIFHDVIEKRMSLFKGLSEVLRNLPEFKL
jgi:hypothetical protein